MRAACRLPGRRCTRGAFGSGHDPDPPERDPRGYQRAEGLLPALYALYAREHIEYVAAQEESLHGLPLPILDQERGAGLQPDVPGRHVRRVRAVRVMDLDVLAKLPQVLPGPG